MRCMFQQQIASVLTMSYKQCAYAGVVIHSHCEKCSHNFRRSRKLFPLPEALNKRWLLLTVLGGEHYPKVMVRKMVGSAHLLKPHID